MTIKDELHSVALEQIVREAQAKAGDGEAWDFGCPAVLQGLIDSGAVWLLEGSAGRAAMRALESGACFLPEVRHKDYYGNVVPSQNDLKPGTKGTLENAASYWGCT